MKKNKKKKQKTNNENLYNFIFYTFSVIIAVCFFLCYFGLINECTRFESANNNIDGKQKNYMEELKFELKNLDRKKKEIITTFDLSSLLEGMSRDKKRNQFLSQIFQSIRIEVNY